VDAPAPSAPAAPPSAQTARRFRLASKGTPRRLAILAVIIAIALVICWWVMIRMPGASYRGALQPLTNEQRTVSARLRTDIERLAGSIGRRSTFHPRQLAEAVLYVKSELADAGYAPRDHSFVSRGTATPNIDAALPGTSSPGEIILIGAHVDSFQGTPGADDNASGVAALLALARSMSGSPCPRPARFAFFINEEPPSFQQADMGSLVYATRCRDDGENIVAMLSLESLGYYRAEPGTQKYPAPLNLLYPSTGDFIAFVGDTGSRALVRRALSTFRDTTPFPSEGAAPPSSIPGVMWSDHWAFRERGYPAIMITGTAPFRNANYHQATDTLDTLDYDRLARVVGGLERVVRDLAAN
jgi:hypothetical protein